MRFVLRMNYGEDVIWLLQDKAVKVQLYAYYGFKIALSTIYMDRARIRNGRDARLQSGR